MTGTLAAAMRSKRASKAIFRGGCAIIGLIGTVAALPPAHAQIAGRPDGMIVENMPHMRAPNMIVENIPHAPPPGFAPINTSFATPATTAAQGTPAFTLGSGTITQTAAQDIIVIDTSQAIIDWTLFDTGIGDGDINFLGTGTELLFTGGVNYTVLNRVVPTDQIRAIRFDGTVTSQISGATGGNIWFYSPGGIVIGATGSFDVGSLVLTTNDIDTSGGLFGPDGEIRFRGAADSASAVVIEAGARLDATNNGSYLALVAPRVVQGGTVDVNGSVAYVAAEQADLTINNGLFDITVTVGTGDGNGVVHSGTTTGQSSTGAQDAQAVYMVAIPKNRAITMLVGGEIGYRPAASAAISNGQIVLSAGANVSTRGTTANPAPAIERDAAAFSSANIDFTGGTLNSDVTAFATDAISAMLSNGRTLTVASGATPYNLDLEARNRIDFGGLLGGGINVGGNVSMISGSSRSLGAVTIATGGASITGLRGASAASSAGTIRIAGALNIDVSSNANTGGTGIGGNVTFDLTGGHFSADSLNILADGIGRNAGSADASLVSNSPFVAGFGPLAPFPSADGADGTGGTVTFNLNGGTANVANLSVTANGLGGAGDPGDANAATTAGNGGSGTGGSATFNGISGSLTVTDTLTVAANGTGGSGGFGSGVAGGDGGAGNGGTATLDMDGTATIDAETVIISSNGIGGFGGSSGLTFTGGGVEIPSALAGTGGDATGGTATFNDTAGVLTFSGLTVSADATGGDGGTNSGVTIGDARDTGGDGGNAFGGNATINLNQDDLIRPVYTVSANANGGGGGDGLDGGTGGGATGGTAALNVNNVQVQLDDPTIRAIATGGNGGFSDGIGGLGGNGGGATGGTARLDVNGANGSISLDFILLQSDGLGGDGGDGGDDFSGGTAGDGGNGGDGTGGASELVARTGGTLTLTGTGRTVSSTGVGGTGGAGGNISMLFGGTAGNGGDGGDGTGGSPTLLAQGGTITANDVILTGAGRGGNAGKGGTDLVVQLGTNGDGGDGTGGNPIIEIQEGSPGIITLGATSMFANGTGGTGTIGGTDIGGRIDIIDTSTDPAGLITMASLTAQALTNSSGATSGFFMTAGSGAVAIAGDLTINVGGNAEFAYDGTGQLTVGGNMSVTSGASILVSHTNNNAPTNSIDVVGSLTASAQGDFDAMAGSIIRAGPSIDIDAAQDASANDLRATELITLTAGENALLNDATTSGPLGGFLNRNGIFVDAGFSFSRFGFEQFDPNFNATITGTVSSFTDIQVRAGGTAIFRNSANVGANNQLLVQSGDDIIVEGGASLASSISPTTVPDPADPFNDGSNLRLEAGALSGLLTSARITPISSIVTAGNLDANNSAVIMSANAIDGLGGTVTASSISADINDAPANGVAQSADAGLLSAGCVAGNVCLGALTADNIVQIGQNSNNDVIDATIEGGTVAADSILITTRRSLIVGTDGIVSTFDGASQILFESTEGNVELRNISATSDTLRIIASNGSLLGTGTLISANDVGITVAEDVFATGIFAGRELTTAANIGGALEGLYSVPGSIFVGTFSQGAGDAKLDAGGDISFDQAIVSPGNDINLLAPNGDVFLGGASGATNISIFGINVEIGSIAADNLIDIGADNDISGNDAVAGGDILLDAGGSIELVSLDAGGMIDASGTDGFEVDTLAAGNDTALRSLNGAVIVNTDIVVTGDLIASGAAILLNAIGDLAVTDTRATNGDIDIITGGDMTINQALSVGNIALTSTGGSVTAGNLEAGLATVTPASTSTGGVQRPLGRIVGSPGVGDITITAATDAVITADAIANNNLFISAFGLIDIQALATGIFIEASSADLNIGSRGQLGTSDLTQDILITNDGANPMVLGGTGTAGAFSLDAAEFARIFSGGDLTIFSTAIAGTGPSLIVEDLTAQVATGAGGPQDGNIGAAGTLTITTAGDMRVNGALALTGANADNLLEMLADQNIRVNANGGNIAVTDANGGLAGQLDLIAQTITAATDAAAADIAGATVADADTRLANNDGIVRDDGFFQADGITFAVSNGLFIQNSAAGTDFDDRRGFVVGDGGLTITSEPLTNIIGIVVNGIQRQSSGTTVTGIAMIAQTMLNTGFAADSTINGCLIAAPATCGAPNPPDDPVQDLIEEEIEEEQIAEQSTTPLIETAEIFPNREGPIIDDPVTGSGNEDLWIRGSGVGGNDD